MNELIVVQNNVPVLENESAEMLIDLDNKIKKLTDIRDDIRSRIKNEMEDKGIKQIINEPNNLIITFTPEDKFVQTFDKKTFRKENPDMYDKYVIFTTKASFITMRQK